MYLAQLPEKSGISYQIRQSYQTDEGSFAYRIVYKLGNNPTKFIEPFADHVVLFDDDLTEAVSAHTAGNSDLILEELLWDFLPTEVQRRHAMFQGRSGYRPGPLTTIERKEIARQIHIIDRRRLYYLRYGAVDQSRLSRLHEKCCRPLLNQSRDEREYYFAAEEKVLQPGSYFQYVYAIFNLQKFFSQSFAPWLPESLAHEEVADHFVEELCRLNRDRRFQLEEAGDSLHYHLMRYLIMFFDHTPAHRSFFDDFIKKFRADHRTFRWPERKSSSSPEKITEIFATSHEELQKMNRDQLSRLYRKKAMHLHPDRGGDHDLFIELTEIYNELLQTK
ncbi:MAG: hypothetical protein WBB19_03765 [Desulforhopalus sp.]